MENKEENENNTLNLNLEQFNFISELYKIPNLHETWTWEGDETVLPYKWADLIKRSGILGNDENDEEFDINGLKQFLKDNYFGLPEFDKLSFFFITYRSQVMACTYLNPKTAMVDYFLINPKGYNKGLENGLFLLIYKRAKELNLNKITINLNNTNVGDEFFLNIGFK